MSDEAFARRFYADRSELLALGVPLAVAARRLHGRGAVHAPAGALLPAAAPPQRRRARRALDRRAPARRPVRLRRAAAPRAPEPRARPPEPVLRRRARGHRAAARQRLHRRGRACGCRSSRRRSRSSARSSSATGRSPPTRRPTRTVDPYSLYLMSGHWYVIGRDHDRDDVRTFRLDRVRGDVRFATRRERDFRVPAGVRPERLPQPRARGSSARRRAARRSSSSPRPPGWSSAPSASTGRVEHRDDRSLLYTTPFADWQELAALADRPRRPGLARSRRPSSSSGSRRRSSASPPTHEGEPRPHAVPLELVDRAPAPERGESPGHARALRGAPGDARRRARGLRRAQGRARSTRPSWPRASSSPTRSSRITCSCSTSSTSAAAATPSTPSASTTDASIHVEKELYGDEFRRPARLSPLEAKALLLALDLVGPLVAADAGTTLDDVRAKLEAAFGRYDMRGAPDAAADAARRGRALGALARRCASRTRRRDRVPRRARPTTVERARRRAALPARRARRLVLRHLGSHAPTASARSASTASARRERCDETFERRASVDRARRRRARRPRRHGVGVVLGRGRALGARGPARHRSAWPTAPRSHRCRTARERWLYTELCRYLGEAVLLEPEPLRARVAARARELAALVRSHATASASVSAPQARWLSDAQVAGAAAAARRGRRARALRARRAGRGHDRAAAEARHPPAPRRLRQRRCRPTLGRSTARGVKLVSVFPGEPRARAARDLGDRDRARQRDRPGARPARRRPR